MRRRAALGTIVALATSCGGAPQLEVQWVHWFSYRDLADVAVGPDGTVIVVGVETAEYQPPFRPFRPWHAELTIDGEYVGESLGFVGVDNQVVIAPDGTSYTARSRSGHFDAPDELDCRVDVRAPDGREMIVRFPAEDGRPDCVEAMAHAGDRLVVHLGHTLVAVGPDGSEAWRTAAPPGTRGPAWHVDGASIWMAGSAEPSSPPDVAQPVLYGLDVGSGAVEHVQAGEPGWLITALGPAPEGWIATMVSGDLFEPRGRVVGLSTEGAVRWQRPLPPPAQSDSPHVRPNRLPGASPTLPIVPVPGGHLRARLLVARGEADDQPPERSIALDGWDHDGRSTGTVSLSFSEDLTDARDRIDCPPNDTPPFDLRGAYPWALVPLGPTTLLIAGRHGCRDSWILRAELVP